MSKAAWGWVREPVKIKITETEKADITKQVLEFSKTRIWCDKYQIVLRFKGEFCYLYELQIGADMPSPLGRARYLGNATWNIDFYAYSSERYMPCAFPGGSMTGTIEEAIMTCELYLL
jgi:hypothetical protein